MYWQKLRMLIIAWHVKLIKSFCLVNRKIRSSQIISFDVHNEPMSRTVAVSSLDSSLRDIDCKSVLLLKLMWGMKWSDWSSELLSWLKDSISFVNKDKKWIYLLFDINKLYKFHVGSVLTKVEFWCLDSLSLYLCIFVLTLHSFMTYIES